MFGGYILFLGGLYPHVSPQDVSKYCDLCASALCHLAQGVSGRDDLCGALAEKNKTKWEDAQESYGNNGI